MLSRLRLEMAKESNLMEDKKRFITCKNYGSVWHIKDTQDDSVVCLIMKGDRGEEKTQAMMNVMVDALNKAVERKNGIGNKRDSYE